MVKLLENGGHNVNSSIKALNPISDGLYIKQHSFESIILKPVKSFAEEQMSTTEMTMEMHCPIWRKGRVENRLRLNVQAP